MSRAVILALLCLGGCGQLDDRGSADDFVPSMVEGDEPPPAPAAPTPDAGPIPDTPDPPNVVAVDALLPLIPPMHRSAAYAVPQRECPADTPCADGPAGAMCWAEFDECARSGLGGDCWGDLEGCFYALTCEPFDVACTDGDMDACATRITCANALGCDIDAERCWALGDPPGMCLDELVGCWSFAGLDDAATCAAAHRDCLDADGDDCEGVTRACMEARGE